MIATQPPEQPILKRPTISSISDNAEELELSYTISGNANKYNQFGKLFGNNYFNSWSWTYSHALCFSSSAPTLTSHRNVRICFLKYMYRDVYGSIILSNQEVNTTQMNINGRKGSKLWYERTVEIQQYQGTPAARTTRVTLTDRMLYKKCNPRGAWVA